MQNKNELLAQFNHQRFIVSEQEQQILTKGLIFLNIVEIPEDCQDERDWATVYGAQEPDETTMLGYYVAFHDSLWHLRDLVEVGSLLSALREMNRISVTSLN